MDTLLTLRNDCIDYANSKGWSLLLIIEPRVDFWRETTWWPEMVEFIHAYPISEQGFDTWDRFCKRTAIENTSDPVSAFKAYAIEYLGVQILRA